MDDEFMCYFCGRTATEAMEILQHSVRNHCDERKFSIRVRQLDECRGTFGYVSQHYGVPLTDISERLNAGAKVIIDSEAVLIRFKSVREDPASDDSVGLPTDPPDGQGETDVFHRLVELLPDIIEILESTERANDLVATLEAIKSGKLSIHNIALNLLLDVGQYLNQSSSGEMRYSKTSLDFWVLVQKLFRGRGVRFFRGGKEHSVTKSKTEDDSSTGDDDRPDSAKINFAVPSKAVLMRESEKYQANADKPGIMSTVLDSFAGAKAKATDCKLSIDGKKLAYGFGAKLGDEDLGGFEDSPTLKEREETLHAEVGVADMVLKELDVIGDIDTELTQIEGNDRLKDSMKKIIHGLSLRSQQLRVMIVKKKHYVQTLVKKVSGPWQDSKLAPAISFIKTQVVKANVCLNNLLNCIDNLGLHVATLNGVGEHYRCGKGIEVDLGRQGNYCCLLELEETQEDDPMVLCDVTKQRTEKWHKLRKGAVVTGSTLHRALGLGTLKDQKTHYDKVFRGVEVEASADLQKALEHGTKNEINALATFVAKIMPVYFPNMLYKEDGCEVKKMGTETGAYAVISGDGTCSSHNDDEKLAIEIKCPMPDKVFVPDVYYKLPVYYGTQVLSQMAAKGCTSFVNICYSSESSTFISGAHDPELWDKTWDLAKELYGYGPKKRPTAKSDKSKTLASALGDFSSRCDFVAEFPSVKGISCKCDQKATGKEDAFHRHCSLPSNCDVMEITVGTCQVAVQTSKEIFQEAYQLLRRPAKEILMGVISDLDRTVDPGHPELPHAVPMFYYLSGPSLKMQVARNIIVKAVSEIAARELSVKAVAFDGQFLEIAVNDLDGKPTTLLKLDKYIWEKAKKVPKDEQIKYLSNLSLTSEKKVYTSRLVAKLAVDQEQKTKKTADCSEEESSDADDYILQYLPDEIVSALDTETLQAVKQVGHTISQSQSQDVPPSEPEKSDERKANEKALPVAELIGLLRTLKISDTRSAKWKELGVDGLQSMLSDATTISKNFVVKELHEILSKSGLKVKPGSKKAQLVNMVSDIYGDGTTVPLNSAVPTLRQLSIAKLKTLPKVCTNILYSVNIWESEKCEYEKSSYFKSDSPSVIQTDDDQFVIDHWYAQPVMICENPVQMVIDPHHLFVNNRARCCSKGMPGMGISPQAWITVAEQECAKGKDEKTGLSLELVVELRDRQRNAYAATTFSEKVEECMIKNGDLREAEWCGLMRNWYAANDEAGISVSQRIRWMLDMRKYLFRFYRPGTSPPPGGYVAGLPMAQFEGILTNIDRRLQLYALVSTGGYNQRSVSSLDSETMFGSFQDLDPKGTGVLRADDIPSAMGTALCLFEQKLDPSRKFSMKTSQKRVYKTHVSASGVAKVDVKASMCTAEQLVDHHYIMARTHFFDKEDRRTTTRKRKSGVISDYRQSSRGAQGVRAFHKTNEEKILAHRRAGISEADV